MSTALSICSVFYGDVRQYSLSILSLEPLSSSVDFDVFFLWKLILFFSYLWYYCVEISAFGIAVPFFFHSFILCFFNYVVYVFFP